MLERLDEGEDDVQDVEGRCRIGIEPRKVELTDQHVHDVAELRNCLGIGWVLTERPKPMQLKKDAEKQAESPGTVRRTNLRPFDQMPSEENAELATQEVKLRLKQTGDVIESEVAREIGQGSDDRVADGGITVGQEPEKAAKLVT